MTADWLSQLSAPAPPRDPVADGLAEFLKLAESHKTTKQLPVWTPHDGPQSEFFHSECEEVLYGGAAGGGKTASAVALPLPWIDQKDLRVLILRRRTVDLNDLIDKAKKVYQSGDAESPRPYSAACPKVEFVASPVHKADFPAGARIYFDHCQNPDDWEKYQGQEYQIIVFEELTQFLEKQYLEIKSRLRSATPGLPRKIRATSNPGGRGASWVMRRWKWWLDPECVIHGRAPRVSAEGKPLPPAAPGEVLWIKRGPGGAEVVSYEGDPEAMSRTFIPARLSDNPTLLASDPNYRTRLADNDPVRARQLIDGDWLVTQAAGMFFRRGWVTFVDREAVPADAKRCRAWDKAATEPSQSNPDPDWTRGVRLARAGSMFYIEDLASVRGAPGQVQATLRATAETDGRTVKIRIPQDPGAAGKSQAAEDVRLLGGFAVTTKTVTGDKPTRFGPVSSQMSPQSTGGATGRFAIVRAPWNEALIQELEAFPDGDHDDIVDALSDAYDELAGAPPPPPRGVGTKPLGFFY